MVCMKSFKSPAVSKLLLSFAISSLLIQAGFGMTMGTYNIRNYNTTDAANGNEWSRRAPVVAGLIRFHGFDLLCVQEMVPDQLKDLRSLLPEHTAVSYGRDDGHEAGEQVGIFYRTEMFKLIESGSFWLSEHPDQPGKGWDAVYPRICTWAKLKRNHDGSELAVFSLHLDHQGQQSQIESAKLVLQKIHELAQGIEVFVAGDLNADQHSEAYKVFETSEKLVDPAKSADFKFIPNGTFNGFDPDFTSIKRIDHIFVSKEIEVSRFGVLTDTYRAPKMAGSKPIADFGNFPEGMKSDDWKAYLPSDHFPLLIETKKP